MTGFIMALQNITRIYLYPLEFKEKTFGRSSLYFPVVGLVIGLLLYLLNQISATVFPPHVVAALILVGHLMITGGMHLDGFMDSMDGLFSGRDRDRKLEIMKDSRVGANGVMAVVLLLLLKYTLLIHLPYSPLVTLIFMAAFARWANVYCFVVFPYVRATGLGRAYKDYTGNKELLVASLVTLGIAWWGWQWRGLVLLLLVWLVTHWVSKSVTKTIGGMTGDIYGFIIEFNEVIVLLATYILVNL